MFSSFFTIVSVVSEFLARSSFVRGRGCPRFRLSWRCGMVSGCDTFDVAACPVLGALSCSPCLVLLGLGGVCE